jgi:hypothetical protein
LGLEDLHAAFARLPINWQETGWTAWRPHQVDLKTSLQAGDNLATFGFSFARILD